MPTSYTSTPASREDRLQLADLVRVARREHEPRGHLERRAQPASAAR